MQNTDKNASVSLWNFTKYYCHGAIWSKRQTESKFGWKKISWLAVSKTV